MSEKPSDMTYREYREQVELAAEVALEAMNEYPEDWDSIDEAVRYAIRGDQLFSDYGYKLMTVLLSDTSPDSPDYCEPWDAYVDLSGEPSWSEAVSQMAWVCYYSDTYGKVCDLLEEDQQEGARD